MIIMLTLMSSPSAGILDNVFVGGYAPSFGHTLYRGIAA